MVLYKNNIESTFEAVHATVGEIMEQLKLVDLLNRDVLLFRVNFMLREILNNAVEHGNKFHDEKKIHIEVLLEDSRLITRVKDEGEGVSFGMSHENNMDNILRERQRGINLVRQYQFEIETEGTEVRVVLDLNSVVEGV